MVETAESKTVQEKVAARQEAESEKRKIRARQASKEKKEKEANAQILRKKLQVVRQEAEIREAEEARKRAEEVAKKETRLQDLKKEVELAKEMPQGEKRLTKQRTLSQTKTSLALFRSREVSIDPEVPPINLEAEKPVPTSILGLKVVQWQGFGYLQSDCGTVLAMNFESDRAPLPVRSMKLSDDGIPVKGMLWRMNADGSLQNKATGLVLQIRSHRTSRKVEVVCDKYTPGDPAQRWYATEDREVYNGAVHGSKTDERYMLTIRNGSTKDRGEVWCNNRKFWQGVTKAQRWTFVPYAGSPKMPAYKINEKHRAILEGAPVL